MGAAVVLTLFIWLNRRGGNTTQTLETLLPSRKAIPYVALPLIIFYGLTSALLRPEAFPGVHGHLTIWAIYAVIGVLFYLALARDRNAPRSSVEVLEGCPFSYRHLWTVFIVMSAVATLAAAIGIGILGVASIWLLSCILGPSLMIQALRQLSR